jgi:hypothetical protein
MLSLFNPFKRITKLNKDTVEITTTISRSGSYAHLGHVPDEDRRRSVNIEYVPVDPYTAVS